MFTYSFFQEIFGLYTVLTDTISIYYNLNAKVVISTTAKAIVKLL